ncbi:M3 family metallopeptidase [Porticoccus sp. W117]|uniref:M3 family metallopeptidase n=1 Tax=Porticoccus sp. W117 TaxID=3054777 RepID=UPI00259673E0|nr:M3 family metallopeptidase [Porticoccus sp. W117]MDM3870991.1 M3 family metallopeptidase [Porticoccus sp. W117]
MKKTLTTLPLALTALALAIGLSACSDQQATVEPEATPEATTAGNPFFSDWGTPFESPDFSRIKHEHYLPAFEKAMADHTAEVQAIIDNPDAPTFDNTIVALERSGQLLTKVGRVFYALSSAHTNPDIQALSKELAPITSSHSDNINLNADLFARVKAVYEQKDALELTTEQRRLLDKRYKGFLRSGANLVGEQKEQMRTINKELSVLTLQFRENLLAESNAFQLVIDNSDDLAGLPDSVVQAAAQTATARGMEGKWVFTLDKPSMIPFLSYAENRELREKLYTGYITRGDQGNANDSNEIVARIANLRLQKANLLGYANHADFVLEENMAKNAGGVYDLLNQLWKPALATAERERAEMQAVIDAEDGHFKLASWDWWYYAEKLRKQKYNLDAAEIKPYLQLENVVDGAFYVAKQLWGVEVKPIDGISKYQEDVRTYEVKDKDGNHLGIFYSDFFPRASKRGGAWMTSFRIQSNLDNNFVTPLIMNVGNYTPPIGDDPALLSFNDVTTIFHEFGHALHGLLSKAHYPSLAGTSTPRDYVEFPAQLYEHWAAHPEVMKQYARHYKTGEAIPDELIAKMKKASTFNQGFKTTEYLAASLLDMAWHSIDSEVTDTRAFETEVLENYGLIPEIVSRYRSTYFAHIFAGGYSAGYYSYIWSEVLDSDGFEAFKETAVFDKETAQRLLEHVYSTGGTEDPGELYRRFRGRDPEIGPLLKSRGFSEE